MRVRIAAISAGVILLSASIAGSAPASAQQAEPQVSTPVPPPAPAPTTLPDLVVETSEKQKKKSASKKQKAKNAGTAQAQKSDAAKPESAPPKAPSTAVLGNLPPAYAGGQVATGGQVGMLGNLGVMDTPFNQTSYTSKTIADQQAKTLNDVLQNDPSVAPMMSRYSSLNTSYFRGFPSPVTYYTDLSLNGLMGIVPSYSPSMYGIERAEVLKGPSALLNGMPVNGAVGGTVNLVTKQAGDEPLTQVTTSYVSDSVIGTNVDVARRYGIDKEFGIRFNGGYYNGDTAIDPQEAEQGVAALNVDYRGEHVRLSADVGYQKDDISATMRFIRTGSLTAAPAAPDSSRSLSPSWAYENSESFYAMMRGEVDLTENITAYAAIGILNFENDRILANSTITNLNGTYNFTPFRQRTFIDPVSAVAGIRAELTTGPIEHTLNFNASRLHQPGGDNNASSPTNVVSNIYNPVFGPSPFVPNTALPIPKYYENDLSSIGISDTISILDKRVQFTAGVRRQRVENGVWYPPPVLPATTYYDASAWTPAYALVVKPWKDVSLYANYIEGLQSGTVVTNDGTYANGGQVFPPYVSKQKEAGVKFDWGTLTTTVAAFEIAQPTTIVVPGVPKPSLQLAGEQVNRGIEFNVFGEVVRGVRVLGGITYIDGRLAKTQNGTWDGRRAQGVPPWRVVLGGEWDMPFMPGMSVNGRVIYTDKQYINNTGNVTIPDWTRVDVGARYTFMQGWNGKPLTVRANIENVFDEDYWVTGNNASIALSQPRTYMLSTTVDF
jgi:iron complex outermembrane receptor protein